MLLMLEDDAERANTRLQGGVRGRMGGGMKCQKPAAAVLATKRPQAGAPAPIASRALLL
jgi:hypothetical protein